MAQTQAGPSDAPAGTGPAAPGETLTLHASCVAWGGRALLLAGPSGAGKSTLALAMMALGADLVADDRTVLRATCDGLSAEAPAPIRGRIEARGIGILAAPAVGPVPVAGLVDLARDETERLPPDRRTVLLGRSIPLVLRVRNAHFSAALIQFLKGGRVA